MDRVGCSRHTCEVAGERSQDLVSSSVEITGDYRFGAFQPLKVLRGAPGVASRGPVWPAGSGGSRS